MESYAVIRPDRYRGDINITLNMQRLKSGGM
jgi:hypothetical protein